MPRTIGSTDCLEYFGMLLNFKEQVITNQEKKHNTCTNLIEKIMTRYRKRLTVTVKDVQKLACHLKFICQAILAGRTFMSGLYSLIAPNNKEKVKPGHHRGLNKEIHDDLVMFQRFLHELSPTTHRSIPFLVKREIAAEDIQLFADGAGNPLLGVSCTFNEQWVARKWAETNIFNAKLNPYIAVLEMLVIVMVVEVWVDRLAGHTIMLQSDNTVTCRWL